jgi:DNA-binding NarL/FixJ family response regulator
MPCGKKRDDDFGFERGMGNSAHRSRRKRPSNQLARRREDHQEARKTGHDADHEYSGYLCRNCARCHGAPCRAAPRDDAPRNSGSPQRTGSTRGDIMKFLVADDHELIRQGVKGMLRGFDPDAQFDEADSWETLATAARPDANHDLAIVDLHMPGMSGASSLETLLKANPALPVVVLSAEESPDEMRAVLAAGALGFVPKRQPASVMLKAIELVLSGGAYVPMEALSLLGSRETHAAGSAAADADRSAGAPVQIATAQAGRAPGPGAGAVAQTEPVTQVPSLQPHQQHLLENLSPRQQDIMRLVHRGWTNKMIARDLGVAEGTVKVHLSVIFRALGVHNRSTAIAVINGWLEAGKTL